MGKKNRSGRRPAPRPAQPRQQGPDVTGLQRPAEAPQAADAAPRRESVTVDGIEVHVSRERLDDYDLVELIGDMVAASDGEAGVEELSLMVRQYRFIFGDDYKAVKDALRERGGGRLTVGDMQGFMIRVLEAVGAKNS